MPGRVIMPWPTSQRYFCPIAPSAPYRSLRCSELPRPRRMAVTSGFNSRQRTMIRTRVNASSIITNSILFPLFRTFRPRGCVYFSALGKRARKDEGKPEKENTLPSGRKIVRLPCFQVGLTYRRASLDLQNGYTPIPGRLSILWPRLNDQSFLSSLLADSPNNLIFASESIKSPP